MLNQLFNESEIFEMIQVEVDLIFEERGLPKRQLSSDNRLNADLTLSSLDLARLCSSLELQTGVDPFQEFVSVTSIRTVGDLVNAYQMCLAGGDPGTQDVEELLAVQRRASARKKT
jgi:acyl carrier protein